MIGPFGRPGPAATFRQQCPQMTQRRCMSVNNFSPPACMSGSVQQDMSSWGRGFVNWFQRAARTASKETLGKLLTKYCFQTDVSVSRIVSQSVGRRMFYGR